VTHPVRTTLVWIGAKSLTALIFRTLTGLGVGGAAREVALDGPSTSEVSSSAAFRAAAKASICLHQRVNKKNEHSGPNSPPILLTIRPRNWPQSHRHSDRLEPSAW